MKPHHYQELQQSAIADDVIQLNFRSLDGYQAFRQFLSLCDSKDNRQGTPTCDRQLQNRYAHLYEGYWYAPSWCPLTNTLEIKQVKPDYPLLRLVTTSGTGKYSQPVDLNHRPDQRYLPRERGYFLANRQTIISIANALQIGDKLPQNQSGQIYLEAISAMSPQEKYQWCLENGVFDLLAFDTLKYETPSGRGTPFIYLDIPMRILEAIASQHQILLPEDYKTWKIEAKWHWIRNHPQIPLFITEGIKKAASLISHAQVAIASFSITTHSEKARVGKSSWHTNLKPELLWLLQKKSGRLIYVVFDAADVKETSRRAVQRETQKIAKKLQKYGTVKVITWDDQSCKGIDDFLAKHGLDGFNEIINNAVDFKKIWQKEIANSGRKLTPNLKIKQRYLAPDLINKARQKGVKLLCIKSPQNTGKSYSYSQSFKQYEEVKNRVQLSDFNCLQNIAKFNNSSTSLKPAKDTNNPLLLEDIKSKLKTSKSDSSSTSLKPDKNTNNLFKLLDIKPQQNTAKFDSSSTCLEPDQDTKKTDEKINNHPQILYQIGEKVKIRVHNHLFDSQILGYNPFDENPYLCQFANGFIQRKAQQIFSPSHHRLPDQLITYGLTHRQSLAWNLADRFALDCYLDNIIPLYSHGIMVSADSSLMIPESKQFTDGVIDESEQVAWHLLASTTEIRHQRINKIERIIHHGQQILLNHGMLTIMDADLSDIGVKFYQMLFNIPDEDTLVVENTFKPFQGRRDCFIYRQIESLRDTIIKSIHKGQRIIIHTSGQKESSTHGTINLEKEIIALFPQLEGKIYRIDQESLGDAGHLSYQILSDLKRLQKAQIIIASSSINTGVSLEQHLIGKIDQVFGIFFGNYPLTDFEQAIERYRGDCPRHIYLKNASSERINLGSYKYSELLENIIGQTHNIHKLLENDFNCDLAFNLVKFYCQFAARINNDYRHLKDNFIYHLEDKGYSLYQGQSLDFKTCHQLKQIYQKIKNQSEQEFQEQAYQVEVPNDKRQLQLEKAKTKTKLECIEEYKGKLARRYQTQTITKELIALDRQGFYPQLQLRFWLMFGVQEAVKRDQRVLSKYAENNDHQGYALDFNQSSKSTQVAVFKHIGLLNTLDALANQQTQALLMMLLAMQFNPLWFKVIDMKKLRGLITELDIIPYLSWRDDQLVKPAMKQVFNLDLDKNQSPIQLFRMILNRIGFSISYVGRYGSRENRKRAYQITNCISIELWDDILADWLEQELREHIRFEEEQKRAA